MTSMKSYRIHLNQVPQHERIIFKLICSVSGKTPGRVCSYVLGDAQPGQTDILIHGDPQSMQEASQFAAPGIVHACLVGKGTGETGPNHIPRPLLATRVLTILDAIMADTATAAAETAAGDRQVPPAPTPATTPAAPASTTGITPDFEFDISIEDASELAVVEDETFTNPANFQTVETAPAPAARSAGNPGLAVVETAAGDSDRPQTESASPRPPRALVVDDSPSVRKQLELELELFKVEADYAADAEQAFELLKNRHYDLALLDVVLPTLDGFEICKHVKASSSDTIVIMLTGRSDQADRVKGSLAGCDAYMVKPVGRNTFQSVVGNYLSLDDSVSLAQA